MTSVGRYKAVRGMGGTLPDANVVWREIEEKIFTILNNYAYEEIRLPIIEYSEVFNRSIGDTSDIVQKEMYSFLDRNNESLTLRPEGTAGCVRAILENNLLNDKTPTRLWYHGPMFRYERPQRGRQRQFHQIGLELFGSKNIQAELELIFILSRIWRSLGLDDLNLEINSLGSTEERNNYKNNLSKYFEQHTDLLDDQSRKRLKDNPLRLLDSKNVEIQKIAATAPSISNYLSKESKERMIQIKNILDSTDIQFSENRHLVRGLDYYSDIVFEWTTNSLGAQNAVCAGGRYDNLVEEMGGKSTAAVGCAIGLERVYELYTQSESGPENLVPKIYVLATDSAFENHTLLLTEKLRHLFPEFCFELHVTGGSLKSKMKKANKSKAEAVIIIGEDELKDNKLTVKALRKQLDQRTGRIEELRELLLDMMD